LDADDNDAVDPNQNMLWQIAEWMHQKGMAGEPNEYAVDRLRQRSSRSIKKAKAYSKEIGLVTYKRPADG
jgi:hypothetical protein